MSNMTNCPNCGAPIVASKCEYCGTVFRNAIPLNSARTFLELENEYLKCHISVQQLYDEAIFAMRAYSNGIVTINEAREMIGLEGR